MESRLLVAALASAFATAMTGGGVLMLSSADRPEAPLQISLGGSTDKVQTTRTVSPDPGLGAATMHEALVEGHQRLIGAEFRNLQHEALGYVSDVVVDRMGRVTALVLDQPQLFGLRRERYVVPWSRLRLAPHSNGVLVNVPQDRVDTEFADFEPIDPAQPTTVARTKRDHH